MRKSLFVLASLLLLTGGVVMTSLHAAPACSKKTCGAAINACIASQCSGLSGKAFRACKSNCSTAVLAACAQDPTVCTPSPSGAFLD
jgi:hypothetical protein